MELSSEILESLVIDDKAVMEVLKDGNVMEGDIIFESEMITEDSEEAEIEEIIEIIEEVEESETPTNDDASDKDKLTDTKDIDTIEKTKRSDRAINKNIELYSFDDENSMFTSQFEKEPIKHVKNSAHKITKKHIINYDVDEDWQDEELERVDGLDNNSELTDNHVNSLRMQTDKKHVNNRTISLQSNKDLKIHVDPMGKVDKSRIESHGNKVNDIVDDSDSTQEIVKNIENNLLYTVLGSKKQDSSTKQQQEKLSDHYVKMERLEANTIPVEGTIYYEGDNMETLYVAQAIDDNEQYQYDNATMEQDEQMSWEVANSETNQNQEDNSQDQIFLHEDEDGQLYFKDASGTLQPVYLTEDGNYAIAESNDDNTNKDSQSKSYQNNSTIQEETFILPDIDSKPTSNKQTTGSTVSSSSFQDYDNEDNTVTISLIISEDENGQKRTQVIIPTTDNLKCDICNRSFKTSFQLLRHNRLKHAREEDITTRNFPCDSCPKRYPDQGSLARHRKTHTGDRPFQCLECHKNFPTSTALRRHLTLHNSQSRPLPCIYCGRRFMDKTSLAKHEESHMPNEQRKYTCDICQKTFHHITDLSMHKKHHDPDKKFDCEVCGREFNRLNNLQRHMLVHQQQQGGNEEILSCDVCGITYKFMSSLTRHMVTTHMNPEKLRQQAEEQRRKRENNYRKYLENRKMYETQNYGTKRKYNLLTGENDETA
ncbi:PREDICTED: zinc finger protein 471 [Trachymyrmex septentrionalis]|uniref:zinc finger protein 471 n=1 Tax=Trachymyrmex septentrionalis TaxID=34720 RepID=UPI00084EDEBD|nr:PREDICTED: zinc finger protein 471 [Trachymyrmex septentrionalis]XP_018338830.1 PREDICTED: zinc finger protein 471 [Trachymyrmex septentrionalis]XP_018338832.1 PREDICTED: zinc finger protein 471 [Trachymyrmex septentrionalis]XP_018338833.1 PREDICTED: zinc finger protein 471 [Trachymyrmex septentrionalis]XP_018338834.1 PREDICTED: zinc finger protein 471 [Trachymyrmex septentrionalis]